MRVSHLTIKNFRCFGDVSATIELDFLTAFIGANGSGKTAVLLALDRLFGDSQAERHLQPEDFRVPHNSDLSTIDKIELVIEARIEFPELFFGGEDNIAVPLQPNDSAERRRRTVLQNSVGGDLDEEQPPGRRHRRTSILGHHHGKASNQFKKAL